MNELSVLHVKYLPRTQLLKLETMKCCSRNDCVVRNFCGSPQWRSQDFIRGGAQQKVRPDNIFCVLGLSSTSVRRKSAPKQRFDDEKFDTVSDLNRKIVSGKREHYSQNALHTRKYEVLRKSYSSTRHLLQFYSKQFFSKTELNAYSLTSNFF